MGVRRGYVVDVLRKSWQFQRVYRLGKKIQCHTAVVFYLQDEQIAEGVSFGFVASKRVGNAVKRNRAKRLLREAGRKIEAKLGRINIWIVLIAKQAILEAGSREVVVDLEKSLREEGLIGRTRLNK